MAMRIIKSTKVDAIWSTFPIATAHLIALEAARRSNLPWLAEFRDPMCDGDYPPDPIVNRAWRSLEREVFAQADSIVVTTPGTAALYANRFPQFDASRIIVIENGYDEEAFARATVDADLNSVGRHDGPLVLLHSGLIYPSERDPTQFFQALALLKRTRRISAADVKIILRASGNETAYRAQLTTLEIGDIVKLEPGIDYLPALREMLTVDGLIVLQATNCNSQIPAKLYEYLRAGRPILALTDPNGDTARVLNQSATGRIAPLDSTEDISVALVNFIKEIRENTWRGAPPDIVRGYSRELQAGRLAQALNSVVDSKRRGLVS